MPESIHKKLGRVRPPRVHIIYEVTTEGAIRRKELPFVVGVLADLSGKPDKPLPPLTSPRRKFVDIDRDNFHEVLASVEPRLAFRVNNKLIDGANDKLPVELRFKHLDDFAPDQVVQQVRPLRELLEIRSRLDGLLAKIDGKEDANTLLKEIINNEEKLRQLAQEAREAEEQSSSQGVTPEPEGGKQ